MVYAKKRRYVAKRRPIKRRSTSRGSMGSQVLSLLKGAALGALKRRLGLNTEEKFVDTAGTTTSTATLVSRIVSPTIAQGLTVGTRSGAGVRVTRIQQRINVAATSAATLGTTIRVITVRHRHSGVPAVGDILQTTTDISSPLHNNLAANHIELISDRSYVLGTALSGTGQLLIENEFSRAIWQMEWTDADTTGVPANLINGAIVTLWMQDAVTTAPVWTSTNRVWFVDN